MPLMRQSNKNFMEIKKYLQTYQPLVYQILLNAISERKLGHATLLVGEAGIPLKETALFIAKSLLCNHPDPLADGDCLICHRIDNGTYADLLVLDGEEETIKKDAVVELTRSFSKTAIEEKGVMIYIINLAEAMTTEAVNSLLKFLEEPTPNTYAILTTQNPAKLLPTVISRCETIRLNLIPRKQILDECESLLVDPKEAELLSFFYNSAELIREKTGSEDGQKIISLFDSIAEALSLDRDSCIDRFESTILPKEGIREAARTIVSLLTIIYRDIVERQLTGTALLPHCDTLIEPLLSIKDERARERLLFLLNVKGELDLYINPALLLDHIIIHLTEEL